MGMRVSLAFFFTSFSLFSTLFPSFFSFSTFFFFALFHIFFTFFTLFPFFHLFSLSFFAFFSHFRWPGRGRSLAALPCLPLPYLTLLLLSSPSLTLIKKKKEHRDFQQISVLRSSCPPKRLIISRSIHMSSCRRWIQIVISNASCLWDVCVVKARTWIGPVFWDRCRSATLMSKAVVKLCVYAGTLERCRFVFWFFGGTGGVFFLWLSP